MTAPDRRRAPAGRNSPPLGTSRPSTGRGSGRRSFATTFVRKDICRGDRLANRSWAGVVAQR